MHIDITSPVRGAIEKGGAPSIENTIAMTGDLPVVKKIQRMPGPVRG